MHYLDGGEEADDVRVASSFKYLDLRHEVLTELLVKLICSYLFDSDFHTCEPVFGFPNNGEGTRTYLMH